MGKLCTPICEDCGHLMSNHNNGKCKKCDCIDYTQVEWIKSLDWDLECERCYNPTNILLKHYKARDGMTYIYEDTGQPIPENERENIWLCWDCDWEIMNGHPMEMDAYEIEMDRQQEEYENDPINNTPPWLVDNNGCNET